MRGHSARGWLLVALACALWFAPGAQARRQQELRYRIEQVWNSALRLVRVDMKLPVTDRDQQGGYVMFDYIANGKRHAGSIELVAQAGASEGATLVIVQVPGMPSYVEQMFLDRLEKKLLTEVGPPSAPVKPPPPPPTVEDAGSSKPKKR